MKSFIMSFSLKGNETALRLREACPEYEFRSICLPDFGMESDRITADEPLLKWIETHFKTDDLLVFIGSVPNIVRLIAPYIRTKDADPGVIVMDEDAAYAVPVLAGREGDIKEHAAILAGKMGAAAVIPKSAGVKAGQ